MYTIRPSLCLLVRTAMPAPEKACIVGGTHVRTPDKSKNGVLTTRSLRRSLRTAY